MSTAEELIQEAEKAVAGMPDHLDAMRDFIDLISSMLKGPALEGENPGLHKLMLVIRNHLDSVIARHFEAEFAINRLAKP